MTRAIVIRQDDTVEERDVGELHELQEIVGGSIELVSLPEDRSAMYVNEEGLFDKRCRFNTVATRVAGLAGRPDLFGSGIRGNVVVVGPVSDDGDDSDVTDRARAWIQTALGELVLGGPTFTPGPWRATPGFKNIVAVDGKILAHEVGPYSRGGGAPHDERAANAQLIAAAPDLLAALQDLVPLIEGEYPEQAKVWLFPAKEAIAKARGEL